MVYASPEAMRTGYQTVEECHTRHNLPPRKGTLRNVFGDPLHSYTLHKALQRASSSSDRRDAMPESTAVDVSFSHPWISTNLWAASLPQQQCSTNRLGPSPPAYTWLDHINMTSLCPNTRRTKASQCHRTKFSSRNSRFYLHSPKQDVRHG